MTKLRWKECRDCGVAPRYKTTSYCKACRKLRADRWRNTPAGRASHLVAQAKSRAKKYGVHFDLSNEWALERLEAGRCEITGIDFDFNALESTTGLNADNTPSIHRFSPTGGYTEENCVVVVWAFNEIAKNYDPLTLAYIFEQAATYYDGRLK